MLSLVVKNFILAILIVLILHFLIKNHMIDISEQHHTHDKKKELFVSNTGDKGILKKSINSTISTISSKTKMPTKNVRFDENLESFNNFDLGSVYNNANNANNPNNANNVEDNIVSNVVNNDLNDKKIKDDLYEFVFNKQAEFGDSSIDSYSIQGGTKIIDGSGGSIGSIGGIGGIGGIGIGESFGQDSIKEFNDSFIDKKSDEMFDGIIGYRESGNFSII